MTTITAKIQILPSIEQAQALLQAFDLYAKACNWLSAKVFETKVLNPLKAITPLCSTCTGTTQTNPRD